MTTSALSLGDLIASSRQGEPLSAEINLISFHPDTRLEQIKVRVAPLAMFKRFNLRRDAFLDQVRFTSVKTRDGFTIKLRSASAVPPSPIEILLETEVNGERTLKQYRLALPANNMPLAKPLPKALPVPAPVNIISKKVPPRVTFGTAGKVTQPAVPRKNTIANKARALPVARPKTQAKQAIVKKPVAKQSITRMPTVKKTVVKKPVVPTRPTVSTGKHNQLQKQAARPPIPPPVRRPRAQVPAQQIVEPVKAAHNTPDQFNGLITYERFVPEEQSANADQPVYTDNYISFVPPPAATHYTIEQGDTLFKIAARKKPQDVTTNQMLFALYKKNSGQLPTIEKIDKLYIGQRLKLPTAAEVRAVSRTQGKNFKQSYLNKHRQRLAKKRKAAQEKEKEKEIKLTQVKQEVAKIAKAAAVATVANANGTVNKQADKKVTFLEGRLRKVKRLLEMEKQQHASTKQVVKEKNRLIQRKDTMLQNMQVAGVKGNKAQNDSLLSTPAAGQIAIPKVEPEQGVAATQTAAGKSGVSAQVAPNKVSLKPETALAAEALQPATDFNKHLTAFWVNTQLRAKSFFSRYPVLSVLLPVVALLGLLMLLFKPGRQKRAVANNASEQLYAAATVEPAVDYVPHGRSRVHNTASPSANPGHVAAEPVNKHAASAAVHMQHAMSPEPAPDSADTHALAVPKENDVLAMNGRGHQTVVINISAPARLNIDVAAEGQELDLLRQQTDKLKDSLRSLENSSQMLSRLNAAQDTV